MRLLGVLLCLVVASTTVGACEADIVVTNADIHTMDPSNAVVDTMAIKNERITYVGPWDECYANNNNIVNLNGLTVIPGLHDAHVHPLEAATSFAACERLDGTRTLEQQKPFIRTCADRTFPESDFSLQWGHFIDTLYEFVDGGGNPATFLDDLSPAGKPLVIMEATSHSVWANTEALRRAGITMDTYIPGGLVYLDATTGQPNGILMENAGNFMMDVAFTASNPQQEAARTAAFRDGIQFGLEVMNKNGITSFTGARAYWRERKVLDVWRSMESTLTARIVMALWAYPAPPAGSALTRDEWDDEQIPQLISMYRDATAPGRFRVTQVKMYVDGIVHQATSRMIQPFRAGRWLDPTLVSEWPDRRGMYYFNGSRLAHYAQRLDEAGFDLHLHTIGDQAVRDGLDAIENVTAFNTQLGIQRRARRHHMTHCEFISDADIPRFASVGAVPDFQLGGEAADPSHYEDNVPKIGDLAFKTMPARRVADAGGHVSLSSDWDVNSPSPFVGMAKSMQRGDESLTFDQALRGYTVEGAYAMNQENNTGALKVGMYGDFVVLDRNIFTETVTRLEGTVVLDTYVGGERVYQAAGTRGGAGPDASVGPTASPSGSSSSISCLTLGVILLAVVLQVWAL